MTSPRETPRAAFSLLSWRVNLTVVIALLVLSVLAWSSTIDQAVSMRGMVMGLGQIGTLAQGDMSVGIFLVMWVTMMVAMMLPTTAPIVLAHLAVTRRQGRGVYGTVLFVVAYLFVWSAIGVIPFIAYKAFAQLADEAAQSQWLPVLAGAILIGAGAYQFTAWKQLCLDKCESPFAFIATHDFGGGARGALRGGAMHGWYCLGCCWPVMAVLLVVGLMNLMWMAAIFALIFAERSWKHGLVLAKIAGVGLMILGALIMVRPGLLPTVSL